MINSYKIINVNYLSKCIIDHELFRNIHELNNNQINIVNEMSKYYLNHEDKAIYKKTDYLCNEKEKICICNIHADDFRRIYNGINYKKDDKYISLFKESK
jgi:hypothetical protein